MNLYQIEKMGEYIKYSTYAASVKVTNLSTNEAYVYEINDNTRDGHKRRIAEATNLQLDTARKIAQAQLTDTNFEDMLILIKSRAGNDVDFSKGQFIYKHNDIKNGKDTIDITFVLDGQSYTCTFDSNGYGKWKLRSRVNIESAEN